MTDTEPGGATPGPIGPPSEQPGPVPGGYVPAEWLQQAPPPPPLPPPVPPPVPPPSTWTAAPPGVGLLPPPPVIPDLIHDVPFLDTPWVPPQSKRQGWMWLVYAVAGFVVGQLGAVLFALVGASIAGKTADLTTISTEAVPPEWYVISTLLGLWVGFIGAPWLASRTQGTRHFVRDLGLRFRWWDILGILIGVAGQVAVSLMYQPFQHDIHNFNAPSQRLTGSAHGGGFIVIAIATVLFAPAMEELFFRGLLLKALVRIMTPLRGAGRARIAGVVVAVIIDGLLFGLAHGEWVQLAGLAFFGVVLAAVSYRTGRLGMNMVAHASFNLVAIISIARDGSVLFH